MSSFTHKKQANDEQNAVDLIYNIKMAGKIIIDTERCKGCTLCMTACPNGCIIISKCSNKAGYFPAESTNNNCIGCAMCAIICPDAVIEVYRDDDTGNGTRKKSKPPLIKEKA